MKFRNRKKMITALVLAVTLLMGNGSIVSASQVGTPVVDILQEYVPNNTRSNIAPSQHINLSNNPYDIEGAFTHQVFTNYSFSADGNGELEFDIIVDYDAYEFEDLPLERQVSVRIEVWQDKWFSDDLVYSKTFYAQRFLNTNGYEDAVICSDIVSGLDEDVDTHYYILICKERDGMSATIDGTISHP